MAKKIILIHFLIIYFFAASSWANDYEESLDGKKINNKITLSDLQNLNESENKEKIIEEYSQFNQLNLDILDYDLVMNDFLYYINIDFSNVTKNPNNIKSVTLNGDYFNDYDDICKY